MIAQAPSVVVVSHDRAFLQAVATDIIVFENKTLTEFNGTIAEYYETMDEKQRYKVCRTHAMQCGCFNLGVGDDHNSQWR